ncbi:MAG: restriction endonuclease subunit S [Chlorobiaceae bacterium]|nr:restriction endonuclease subunit S [Chlorobiaceae bacterium]
MSISPFVIKMEDITRTPWLGVRPFTCYFTKQALPDFIKKYSAKGYERLGKFVLTLRSGEYIPKDNYASAETNYVYLSVNNFSKGYLNLTECTYLETDAGEKYSSMKVEDGDIIITRSGTVGRVAVFHVPEKMIEKTFIPSHHLAIIKTSTPRDHLFLKYYLSFSFCKDFFDALSTGKVQKEITNWAIRKIPIPLLLNRSLLKKEFSKIDKWIGALEIKNVSLQTIVDEVLTQFKLKTNAESTYRAETLVPCLKDVAQNRAIRLGAQYNAFWLNHDGHLFEGTDKKWQNAPLKRTARMAQKIVLKKGVLPQPRTLIDFDQVESPNGRITDFENIVAELGSGRIEFGNCDFLTNKLRPYLGYTILNKPEDKLIGTTEFIPFVIRNKSKVSVEYLRCLLLSTEYLEKSKFLMSGKEHPRINSIDILNIKVPLPDIKTQRAIVKEIKKREAKSQKAREIIKKLREQIDKLILEALSKNGN